MDFSRVKGDLAILRFHFHVGIRLGMKVLAPALALAFASFYIFKLELFVFLAQVIFLEGHVLISGLLFTTITLLACRAISYRVITGLHGWIRHLPFSSPMHRRLAGFSIFVAVSPMLFVMAWLILLLSGGLEIAPWIYLAGLPVLGLSSAFVVLPIGRAVYAKPAALFGCLLASSGNWSLIGLSLLMIIFSDFLSGPLRIQRLKDRPRISFNIVGFGALLSLRSLGLRLGYPYLWALSVFGLMRIFSLNNPADASLSAAVATFGGGAGLSLFCAVLAHEISIRRPPWPWSRSLPWSSMRRILQDTFLMGFLALPLFFIYSFLSIDSVIPLLLSFPSLSAFSAYTMRAGYNFRTGAYGRIIICGILGALLLSLWPWLAFLFLILSPVLFNWAIRTERNLKVSRWIERHHLPAGDSLSWSRE